MNLSPVLQLKGISKRFPGVIALDRVDLEVYPAEVVALIGENGAGKSTLMKVLGGVTKPDDGTIRLDDRAIQIHSPRVASELGIEFIHQELSVLDNLDVGANIFLRREPTKGGWLKLVDRKRIYAESDALLRKLGLNLSSSTPLSKLSIAQQQLVEIARSINAGARILIMDEPTSSLTLGETQKLLEMTRDLKVHGVSIIYVSHRLEEIEKIADRAVVLRDGRNVGVLEREQLKRKQMVSMMVGRDLQDFYMTDRRAEKQDCEWFTVDNLRTAKYPEQAVSFSVGKGEVVGFAGLVGSGRSEVAQAIFGVDEAVQSDVKLNGKRLAIDSANDAIRVGIYLVPEDRRGCGLIVDDAIRENISLPGLKRYASAGLVNRAREDAKAVEMCRAINIKTPSTKMRAAKLSGGNQKKVVLAKWLALAPKVLIFDEPTRGIDVGAKAEIYALIRELAGQGVSIIAISSDMEEVLGISDRIAVMHEGKITGTLERSQFSEEAVMRLATGSEGLILK
jgi:ribose transport system ATP-binding protein